MTIGIIDNNSVVRKSRSLEEKYVAHLADDSMAAAGWLIVLNIIVIIWEIPHIVGPFLSVHHKFIHRYTVILQIIVSSFN